MVFLLCRSLAELPVDPSNPTCASAATSSAQLVWAPPLSLATTQGIFSAPAGTKMFQFPAFPLYAYLFHHTVIGLSPDRVSPFRYPRIFACTRLPVAFRSVPRLSSALDA
jgi:hypothetical protein